MIFIGASGFADTVVLRGEGISMTGSTMADQELEKRCSATRSNQQRYSIISMRRERGIGDQI